MKIVWLAPFPIDRIKGIKLIKPSKGRGTWLFNLSESLKLIEGIELHIVNYTANTKTDQILFDGNITYHIIKHSIPFTFKGFPKFFRLDTLLRYPILKNKLERIVRVINPDIIHVHGTENAFGLVPIKINIPCIISIQGIINQLLKIEPKSFYRFQKGVEKKAIIKNTNFGCRTEFDETFVKSINPDALVYYLPEVINDVYFNSRWKFNDSHNIIFLATVVKRKGIEDLIEIFASLVKKYSSSKLIILGSYENRYFQFLLNKIRELGIIDNVLWKGFLTPDEIVGQMLSSRMFVLPTYADNSPNSLAEAMAIGMPCISYATGGIPSLIKEEFDALLVKTGDKEHLKMQIERLLNDSNLCNHLSNNARTTAINRNHAPSVTKLTLEVYSKVIKNDRY